MRLVCCFGELLYQTVSIAIDSRSDFGSVLPDSPLLDSRSGERQHCLRYLFIIHKAEHLRGRPLGRAPPGRITTVRFQLLRIERRYQMRIYVDTITVVAT